MRKLKLNSETKKNILENLLKRSPNQYDQYADIVADILKNVKEKKDQALFDYTLKFDKAVINKETIRVTEAEIEEAYQSIDSSLLAVIRKAKEKIEAYHSKQKSYGWFDTTENGTILGQRVTPIEAAGVYVP